MSPCGRLEPCGTRRGVTATGLQGSGAARQQGYEATRQQGKRAPAANRCHNGVLSAKGRLLSPQSSVLSTRHCRLSTQHSALGTVLAGLLIGVVLAGGAGCGYSTRRPFPDGIRTVHVKTFESKEFRRDLEFALTEAVVKRINLDTPYRIAPLKSADTVLTGEVLEVRNRTIGDDFETQLPRETASTIIVAFRWKDLRSGRILVERERFLFTTPYIPPVGETFATGQIRGMDNLAEAIVETMESPW